MTASRRPKTTETLIGRAIPLAGLVEYQAGAVVSRTVLSKKAGTVTVFAFDKGQGLSTHSAPFDAMVWILDGAARITISGKALRAKAGDMVIMPAHEPHALKAVQRFKMALVMIKS
ncbi:MAG: cupin domain-containing protein [Verrucomicrobia bacterium]|nr:cupin domain-containing protein [Verrucomicrobiota bacterium]MBU1910743.1 cupin domain-containing protein [Verrucomicrobiota bacterium]